jgi:hypothetical protein
MTVCSKDRISTPFLIILIGFFLLVSCRKNEDTVGSDFIGARVGFDVQSSDTSSAIAYTSLHDSFPTNKLSYYMLGTMNDPNFGTITAAIATQIGIPSIGFEGFKKFTIDSIVLQLKYAGSSSLYGNSSTTQIFKVYELSEGLPETGLYSNKSYQKNSVAIGTCYTNLTHLGDSVPLTLNGQTVNLAPHIRIKLDDAGFVSKFQNTDSSVYIDNKVFLSFLKGLYIVPEIGPLSVGQGGIAYMNLASATTSMVVYYNGSFKAEFPISSINTLKGNTFSHSFSSNIVTQPAMGGTHKNTCYVQPGGGLKTRILFPHLFDFAKNKNIAITGAEVTVNIDQTVDTSVYKLPVRLLLNSSNSFGALEQPIDLVTVDGIAYYGGYYNSNGTYSFNIQREIQYWFNQYKNKNTSINYGLNLIVPSDNPVGANRAVLDTRAGKVKLKLSYTVIK